MPQRGYFTWQLSSKLRVRLHYSLAVAALLLSELRLEPSIWLAYWSLVIWHVLGHALLAAALGLRVRGVTLVAWGGDADYAGGRAEARLGAAWGGILAHAVLMLGFLLARGAAGLDSAVGLARLVQQTNLLLLLVNLLPFAAFDGRLAWKSGALRGQGRSPWAAIRGWAAQRRRRRATTGSEESHPAASRWRRIPNHEHSQPRPESKPDPETPADSQPSADAQRELARLLDKVADEAGKAAGKHK